MTGTKQEAKAVESQAIGCAYRQGQKAKVTVVRFVIRNTIDHELYLRNTEAPAQKGNWHCSYFYVIIRMRIRVAVSDELA